MERSNLLYWLIVLIISILLGILRWRLRRKIREARDKALQNPNHILHRYKGRYHLLVIYFLVTMIVCTAVGFGVLYAIDYNGAKSSTTINVEKCLEKPNFKQDGGQIIETLESPAVVLEKYSKSEKGKETYTVKVELTDSKVNGMQAEVLVTQEEFEKISENDLLHLTRTVHYTLNGVRLDYEDKLSGGKL